jgi:vancomycin permeability regulator SanA
MATEPQPLFPHPTPDPPKNSSEQASPQQTQKAQGRHRSFKKRILWLIVLGFIALVVFWLPYLIISYLTQSQILTSPEALQKKDAALIFGANLNSKQKPSPILQERLGAGEIIWKEGKTEILVASNAPRAAQVMFQELETAGIPEKQIELDPQALSTPDTCRAEIKKFSSRREVVFVSQRYHLPRIIYHCQKLGLKGVGLAADELEVIDRSHYSWWTKFTTRTRRYSREALLTWLVVLDLYR